MSKITQVCKVCNIGKPQEEYYFHSISDNRLRKDCKECVGIRHREKKFGIDHKAYLALVENQKGRCAICAIHMDDYSERYTNLHVDHCHDTGKIRGLLCHNCNRAIGMLQNSPELLEIAADYLRG